MIVAWTAGTQSLGDGWVVYRVGAGEVARAASGLERRRYGVARITGRATMTAHRPTLTGRGVVAWPADDGDELLEWIDDE